MEDYKFHPNVEGVPAKNGRIAILARLSTSEPWYQIESILGEDNAKEFMRELANDPDKLASAVADARNEPEDWGDDAPASPV